MAVNTCEDATEQLVAGLASFLDEEMRLYKPSIRRQAPKRDHFERKDQFYWLVRVAVNHLFTVGHDSDFVVGVALVRESGMHLHVFTNNYQLASQIDRTHTLVSYVLYATKTYDKDMGDVWVLKVVREHQ